MRGGGGGERAPRPRADRSPPDLAVAEGSRASCLHRRGAAAGGQVAAASEVAALSVGPPSFRHTPAVPTLLQLAPAVVAVVLMFAVGMSIRPGALRAALATPGLIAMLVGGQVVLVPIVGVAAAWLLGRSGHDGRTVALWVMLLASCPGGAISSALVLYGRGDVALSVLLTGATSLLAAFTMPLVLLALHHAGLVPPIEVPAATLLAQSILLLLLPCLLGMLVRRRRGDAADRLVKIAGGAGAVLLVATLGFTMAEQRETLRGVWSAAASAAMVFVVCAGALGAAIASAARLDPAKRFTVVVEFAVRNVAAAFAISILGFGRDDFAAFGAVYLGAEVLLLAGLAAARRRHAIPAGVAA